MWICGDTGPIHLPSHDQPSSHNQPSHDQFTLHKDTVEELKGCDKKNTMSSHYLSHNLPSHLMFD